MKIPFFISAVDDDEGEERASETLFRVSLCGGGEGTRGDTTIIHMRAAAVQPGAKSIIKTSLRRDLFLSKRP